jgi:hypothetical protein
LFQTIYIAFTKRHAASYIDETTMRVLFRRVFGRRIPVADCIALMICVLFGLTSLVLARSPRSVTDAHNYYPRLLPHAAASAMLKK